MFPKVTGDWWRHFATQFASQAVFWALSWLAHYDWSALGFYAPMIPTAVAVLTTIATEAFNQALATPVAPAASAAPAGNGGGGRGAER